MSNVQGGNALSVVVPVRNDALRLERCLRSIRGCDLECELIVVDNGSEDESVAVGQRAEARVLSFPGLRVGALRNRGVAASNGQILAFVDSDHEVPPDWLSRGCEALVGEPQAVAAGAFCAAPPAGTWVQRIWAIHRLRQPRRAFVDWLGSGNLFVRREAFEAIGGFDESLVAAEDVDLCHRLRSSGGKIVYDPRIVNVHHGEPATLRAFCKKEYWRATSGIKAWVKHGFPLRDLPSLAWPLWHIAGLAIIGALLIVALFSRERAVFWGLVAAVAVWFLPSLVLAARICASEQRLGSIFKLSVLYFAYGLSRAFALWK